MFENSRSYLESFLQNLQNLPKDLHKQFTEIKNLDSQMKDIYTEMTKQQTLYLKNALASKQMNCLKQTDKINDQIKIGKHNCDEKFRIINEIYDTVDNCIRQLDSDFSSFETHLKRGVNDSTEEVKSNIKIKPSKLLLKKLEKGKYSNNKRGRSSSELIASKLSSLTKSKTFRKAQNIKKSSQNLLLKKFFKSNEHAGIPASASLVLTLTNNPNEVLDMPMDPYEPIYCDCHDVSYGDMIGCDNPDCAIEWFHFACVGITDKPLGAWYCPRCRVSSTKQS